MRAHAICLKGTLHSFVKQAQNGNCASPDCFVQEVEPG
jgi:hypothetical protein